MCKCHEHHRYHGWSFCGHRLDRILLSIFCGSFKGTRDDRNLYSHSCRKSCWISSIQFSDRRKFIWVTPEVCFLDLCLGALAIIGDYSDANRLAFINPLLIFGVAIFRYCLCHDSATYARKISVSWKQRSFCNPTENCGWPVPRIVIGSYVAAAALCILAFVKYVSACQLFAWACMLRSRSVFSWLVFCFPELELRDGNGSSDHWSGTRWT